MTMLAAALQLATVGPVMPVKGKRPLWPDWPNRATRTPEGADWTQATGVGLLTGERAGYFVLDVDGAHGAATLQALEGANGTLPKTWCSHTGGGGAHLFFKHPGFPVRGSAGKLGKGLDVRGECGQVVAPPSKHPSGAEYRWSSDPWETPLAAAPEWLLARLRPEPPSPPVRLVPQTDEVLRRASAYLARIPPAVSGAGGHDQTWGAALAVVRGFALGESEAFELLWSEYNHRCDPPWTVRELRHKVADAARNGQTPIGYLRDAPRPDPRPAASRIVQMSPVPIGDSLFKPLGVLLDKEIPPPEWLVSPWLLKRSLAIAVAAPNAGKTLLALDFGLQTAAKGAKVGVIEEEGSEGGFQLRMRRSYEAAGALPELRERVLWSWNKGISLARDSAAIAKASAGLDLLIIDSLAAVCPGVDENDSKEMSQIADTLHALVRQTGAALLALHHMTKEAWKPGQKPTLASLRGHGALAARADTAIGLVPLEEAAGVVRFELHVLKQREAERAPPRRMEVLMTGPAAVVSSQDSTPPADSSAEADVLARIPDPPESVSKKYLENVVRGHGAQKIRRAVDRLVDARRVIVTPRGGFTRAVSHTASDDPRRPRTTPPRRPTTPKGVGTDDLVQTPDEEED